MEKKDVELVKKLKIKMLGNYKEYVNGETYELDETVAMAYVVMGLAILN